MTDAQTDALRMQAIDRRLTALLHQCGSRCSYAWIGRDGSTFTSEFDCRTDATHTLTIVRRWGWPAVVLRDEALGWCVVCAPDLARNLQRKTA